MYGDESNKDEEEHDTHRENQWVPSERELICLLRKMVMKRYFKFKEIIAIKI